MKLIKKVGYTGIHCIFLYTGGTDNRVVGEEKVHTEIIVNV